METRTISNPVPRNHKESNTAPQKDARARSQIKASPSPRTAIPEDPQDAYSQDTSFCSNVSLISDTSTCNTTSDDEEAFNIGVAFDTRCTVDASIEANRSGNLTSVSATWNNSVVQTVAKDFLPTPSKHAAISLVGLGISGVDGVGRCFDGLGIVNLRFTGIGCATPGKHGLPGTIEGDCPSTLLQDEDEVPNDASEAIPSLSRTFVEETLYTFTQDPYHHHCGLGRGLGPILEDSDDLIMIDADLNRHDVPNTVLPSTSTSSAITDITICSENPDKRNNGSKQAGVPCGTSDKDSSLTPMRRQLTRDLSAPTISSLLKAKMPLKQRFPPVSYARIRSHSSPVASGTRSGTPDPRARPRRHTLDNEKRTSWTSSI